MQSQAARAQRKAETYRRRMAALGQPVVAAEPSPTYAPAFQQPYQGMYLDPYAAAQGYEAPQYTHVPVYPNYPDRAFPAEVPLTGALQWEMPQAVTAGRRSGQARHVGKPQLQPDPGFDLGYAEQGSRRVADVPYKEAHHGRRSGVSPSRRRVTAAADPADRLPTVKEMHLQRVATMAAATATAQQTNADVESHEQFARELRSYRTQVPGEGKRGVAKPSWESDLGEGGTFEAAYESVPGELLWQTRGTPHQLVVAPAARQPASGVAKKKSGVPGKQKASPVPQAPELARPSGVQTDMQPFPAGLRVVEGVGAPHSSDPPDMPGINRAGLLNLRNKLRSRPAMMSPPPNAFATPAVALPSGMPAKVGLLDRQRNQENFGAPHATLPQVGSSAILPGKQQTLPRRRVLPSQQGMQCREPPAARSDSSLSSSSSSTSGSSSSSPVSRTSGLPVRGEVAGQGMARTAPRAAAARAAALKPRTTRDSEVDSQLGDPGNALGMAASPGDLQQCEGCGRSFNPKAFEIHSRICAKVFQTKRKGFNAAEARVADTGAAQFFDPKRGLPKAEAGVLSTPRPGKKAVRGLPRGGSGGVTPSHADKMVGVQGKAGAKWRNQSDQLRAAMASSKGGPEASVTAFGGAPIASAPDPSLVPCPHCGRRFNEIAAERHIPKCQDIRAKPSRLLAGAGQKRQPALSPASRGWG
ncbi:Zinc finger C2HC domain-containing protein 1A [Trebouxia sp. C0010 RCD-2024]